MVQSYLISLKRLIGDIMAINILKKITEQDACSLLMKQEQELHVGNVDDIKESTRKENQYYCYIDFEMKDGTQFGASYSFYLEDGVFKCGTSSKLFYLMKGFLNLNPLTDVGLTFDKNDIAETILNKRFLASAIVQSVGGKNYPYIVCNKVIE